MARSQGKSFDDQPSRQVTPESPDAGVVGFHVAPAALAVNPDVGADVRAREPLPAAAADPEGRQDGFAAFQFRFPLIEPLPLPGLILRLCGEFAFHPGDLLLLRGEDFLSLVAVLLRPCEGLLTPIEIGGPFPLDEPR